MKKGKCHAHLHEEESGRLQTCWPALNPWEDYGENPPGSPVQANEGGHDLEEPEGIFPRANCASSTFLSPLIRRPRAQRENNDCCIP